jgi:hypothetical protein
MKRGQGHRFGPLPERARGLGSKSRTGTFSSLPLADLRGPPARALLLPPRAGFLAGDVTGSELLPLFITP